MLYASSSEYSRVDILYVVIGGVRAIIADDDDGDVVY